MNLLLPALRAYLDRELVAPDGNPTTEKPLRICDIKPDSWIVANRKADFFPGAFVWALGTNTAEGPVSDTITEILSVKITLYMQSTDPNYAAFGESQGLFPLSKRIVTLLGNNKKLTDADGKNPVITGLNWNIQRIDGQLVTPDPFTFHGISQDIILEYHREDVEWHWLQNDETQDFNFR